MPRAKIKPIKRAPSAKRMNDKTREVLMLLQSIFLTMGGVDGRIARVEALLKAKYPVEFDELKEMVSGN